MKIKDLLTARYMWFACTRNIGAGKPIANKLFGKYLFATNVITGGVLMSLGDIIQQEIEIQKANQIFPKLKKRYDWKRVQRMFWVGIAQGPPQHIFFKYLDRYYPGYDYISIIKKILLDQIIQSPLCIALFFMTNGALEGQEFSEMKAELKKKFLVVYCVDWLLWPPVQVLNFYYVPPQYRVVCVNLTTVMYNVFLSFVKHND